MGYSTDETVKKYIGWVDEKVAEKSDEFFKQEENSLGEMLLMAKYDKMNEANRRESEKKMQLAIAEIRRTASEGNAISVSDLSRNTGLSKGFFYKNEQVRNILDEEKEKSGSFAYGRFDSFYNHSHPSSGFLFCDQRV